jgi:hypothetical protein
MRASATASFVLKLRAMGQRQKPATRDDEQAMRDQEVLRANKELAAYFKGQRTEREARAALKIIKAFVRGREDLDPKSRPALPGARTAETAKKPAEPRRAPEPRKQRRKAHEAMQPSEADLTKTPE